MNVFALLRNALWTACFSIALIVLFSCGRSANAQSPQAIFPTASPINLSGFPVFTGDFNGDGKPDLAYLLQGNTQWSLGIMLSFGSNAPATVTTYLCPNGQEPSVSFGDVNHDKKLDLVFWCNGYITIQLGNGDGTFQTPAYDAVRRIASLEHINRNDRVCYGRAQPRSVFRAITPTLDSCWGTCLCGSYGLCLCSQGDRALEPPIALA